MLMHAYDVGLRSPLNGVRDPYSGGSSLIQLRGQSEPRLLSARQESKQRTNYPTYLCTSYGCLHRFLSHKPNASVQKRNKSFSEYQNLTYFVSYQFYYQ